MARVITNQGTQVTGRIGEVVHVRYRGGIYIRKAPKKRRDANEPGMLLNQHRFAQITKFCVQFKYMLIPQIWNDAATTGSGYNLLMKTNSPAFAMDGSIAEPLLLKFSVGKLLLPKELMAQRMAPESEMISVSWQKDIHLSGLRLKDDLMMISSDGEHFSSMTLTGIKRKDLGGTFPLPVSPRGAGYLYLFFAAEDRRSFSESLSFKLW